MKYRMEVQYADTNLGVALFDQRRFHEAAALYLEALKTIEAIAAADPQNLSYQQNSAEALTWLADAQFAMGDLRGATQSRRRDLAQIERLFAATGSTDYQNRLAPTHRMLGMLYNSQGQTGAATAEFRAAVNVADALVPKEPTNTLWQEYDYRAKLDLGRHLLLTGDRQEAASQISAACAIVSGLLKSDSPKREWRVGASRCLALQARLALAGGARDEALKFAERALLAAKQIPAGDRVTHAYLLAQYQLLIGDCHRALGDAGSARSAWLAALALLPRGVAEEPDEMSERATIMERLGKSGEVQAMRSRLAKMGYTRID
jgi:tetratricopeptide (TPR) repeat protein